MSNLLISPSNESTLGFSPLLDDAENGRIVDGGEVRTTNTHQSSIKRCSERCKRASTVGCPCCFLIFMLVSAVMGYFINNGAFNHVSRDVRIANGSVVEPNTHQRFPVNRMYMLDGSLRPQRLIGVFLKTKHVPEIEATLHVFVLACYVDRAEGRRELTRYRSGVPHPHQDDKAFAQFVDTISSGRVSFTGEYRMVMTPAGSIMQERWLGDLVKIWENDFGLNPDRIRTLRQCFEAWFDHPGFRNKDDILIESNSKSKSSRATLNGRDLHPMCKDEMFGRAFIAHEFRENGNLPGDLLPTLWNTEYDEEE